MADIQIHELSQLSRALASADVLAVDTGTVTWKVPFSALASAVIGTMPKIVSGQTASTTTLSVPANSAANVVFTFANGVPANTTFSSAPKVYAQLTGGNGATTSYRGQMTAFVDSVSTTQVTIRVYNASAATISCGVNWIAIGS